jgi:hypothetical protein
MAGGPYGYPTYGAFPPSPYYSQHQPVPYHPYGLPYAQGPWAYHTQGLNTPHDVPAHAPQMMGTPVTEYVTQLNAAPARSPAAAPSFAHTPPAPLVTTTATGTGTDDLSKVLAGLNDMQQTKIVQLLVGPRINP